MMPYRNTHATVCPPVNVSSTCTCTCSVTPHQCVAVLHCTSVRQCYTAPVCISVTLHQCASVSWCLPRGSGRGEAWRAGAPVRHNARGIAAEVRKEKQRKVNSHSLKHSRVHAQVHVEVNDAISFLIPSHL